MLWSELLLVERRPLSTAHSEQRDSERQPFFIACVPVEQVSAEADIDILLVGRKYWLDLLASKLERLALNILSTGVMVQLGKVYGNRMVDVAVTNKKLRDRACGFCKISYLVPAASILEQVATRSVGSANVDGFEPRGRRSPFGRT